MHALLRLGAAAAAALAALASHRRSAALAKQEPYDVVVVGGGVMGVWSAIAAARQNKSVCLVERHAAGHAQGSSHGDGRIYRFAYADEIYVDMMYLALAYWGELNANKTVLAHTGGVSLYSGAGGNYDSHGGIEALEAMYAKRGLAHERLSRRQLRARFPQFAAPKNTTALYSPDFGVLFADAAMENAWALARRLGVATREGADVVRVRRTQARVTVTLAGGERLTARAAIIAPGAWLTVVAKRWFGLEVPTAVTRETVSYFKPRGSRAVYGYKRMPVFISDAANGLGALGYYGIPIVSVPGVKVAAHHAGTVLDAKTLRTHDAAGDPAIVAANERFVARFFPGLEPAPFRSESCLYTTTPDTHYVLDRVPGRGAPVVLAGGGSGHAFKMGPAIGDAAAALALGAAPPFSLETFRLDRPALRGRAP